MFWKETADLPLYFCRGKAGLSTCFYDADFISLGIESSGHSWAAMQLRTQSRAEAEAEKALEPRRGCAPARPCLQPEPRRPPPPRGRAEPGHRPRQTPPTRLRHQTRLSRAEAAAASKTAPPATPFPPSLPPSALFKVVARAIAPVPRVVKNNERRKLRLVMSFWIKI